MALLSADNHCLMDPCEVITRGGAQISMCAPVGARTQEAAEVQASAMASQGSSRGAVAGSKRKAVDRDEKAGKAAKARWDHEAQVGMHMASCCCAQADAGRASAWQGMLGPGDPSGMLGNASRLCMT